MTLSLATGLGLTMVPDLDASAPPDPDEASLDFSAADNTQYLALLEDI